MDQSNNGALPGAPSPFVPYPSRHRLREDGALLFLNFAESTNLETEVWGGF